MGVVMEDIQMTQTGLMPGKKGKIVHVCFERTQGKRKDYAEIVMPSGRVLSNKGFSDEEVAQFRIYLKAHKHEIFVTAKQINHDMIFKL